MKIEANYSANPNYFTRVIRKDLISVHWKFIGESEVEIAVRAKTLSWIGIGWRPRSLTASCRAAFPTLSSRPTADIDYADFLEQQSSFSKAMVSNCLLYICKHAFVFNQQCKLY